MSSARKDPVEKPIIQLRITLDDVLPAVWRRLLVPGDLRLSDLHAVFQIAMGWTDSHLHSFSIGNKVFGAQYEDHPKEELDEKSVTLVEALGDLRRFHYAYDFGDCHPPPLRDHPSATSKGPPRPSARAGRL